MSSSDPRGLRARHPVFTYHSFSHQQKGNNFIASFNYSLQNGPQFTHQVIFDSPRDFPDSHILDNLVFNLGIIEGFSYWKLAASPIFQIDAGSLNDQQLSFWHNLLMNGMGEFFYVNQIDFRDKDFVKIIAPMRDRKQKMQLPNSPNNSVSALNIGGGKDSAVMLSVFTKNNNHEELNGQSETQHEKSPNNAASFVNLIVNPASPAAAKMAELSRQPTYFIIRQFDPALTTLNAQNYYNGHVPFSASLAFINTLASVLYNFQNAIVGNENSSDEQSLMWHDCPINHQFSKSTKFEQLFRDYSSQFLLKNFNYFSLIRPLNELQIANIFSSNQQFFSTFKSCNRAQREDHWCHDCAKCLFVFLILSPFIDESILSTKIFSRNLLNDHNLLSLLKQLVGLTPAKPLECVGTVSDSQAAFYLTLQRYQQQNLPLPALLTVLQKDVLSLRSDWSQFTKKLLTDFNNVHFLPPFALSLLQRTLLAN